MNAESGACHWVSASSVSRHGGSLIWTLGRPHHLQAFSGPFFLFWDLGHSCQSLQIPSMESCYCSPESWYLKRRLGYRALATLQLGHRENCYIYTHTWFSQVTRTSFEGPNLGSYACFLDHQSIKPLKIWPLFSWSPALPFGQRDHYFLSKKLTY